MSDVQGASSASTSSFVAALVLNAAIFGAEIVAFTVLRRHFPAIYEPRSRFLPEGKRQRPLGDGLLSWPMAIYKADHEDIKMHNGMDAYFFVRFLRMMVRIFLPFWIVSWAVLLPVDAAGINNKDGLDQFTFGNIPGNSQVRYAAHLILAWFGTFWVLYNIKKEMRNFVEKRQRHLVDPIHSASAQANTVLITGVPRKFLDEEALAQLFQHVPGGVKKVWLNRDLKDLPDIYDRRTAASNKLESAEFALVATAQKLHRKHTLALAKAAKKGQDITTVKPPVPDADLENAAVADRYVPRSERPTHRLPPFKWLPFGLPFMGEKVDTIEWARKEVLESDKLLTEGRQKLAEDRANIGVDLDENYPPLNSAFILFNQQIGAHIAAQILVHNQPYRMAEKHTEVAPADVIWGNLGINPYEARIRRAISYAATAALIIFWAIPVSFVGIVSNVAQLCAKYRWLHWLCELPDAVVGIISGILPPVALAILMMLLPIVLRLLARFEGIPRFTGLELSLMTRYSIISPVINGLVCVAFFLFYQVWKYLFLWQFGQPPAGDTGGMFFPKAMQHIFVGLYIEQICLCALFFLSRDAQNRASAIPQGALMVALIIITAGYHFVLNDSYNALLHPLPLTLAHKSYGMPKEHHPSQDDEAVRDEDELRERDFARQPSSDSAIRPLRKEEPLTIEQRAKLDRIERERAEHEMYAKMAPTKSEKYGKNVAEEGKQNDGPEDFTHPAAIEPQRVVWLPRDPLGVAEAEESELKSQGIEVSTENAVMNEKGDVELTGPPPGGEEDALFG
ncbi:hypothetical protein FRC11_003222 [Ceratobasidium sp. 423]|nr:hypothetical protein FRC11_003222 [Ceratobasidium sp. 423]